MKRREIILIANTKDEEALKALNDALSITGKNGKPAFEITVMRTKPWNN